MEKNVNAAMVTADLLLADGEQTEDGSGCFDVFLGRFVRQVERLFAIPNNVLIQVDSSSSKSIVFSSMLVAFSLDFP